MKTKQILPIRQLSNIRANYPDGIVVNIGRNSWSWTYQVQPRLSSPFYRFKIVYTNNTPSVYALDKLELAAGQNRLPHVYSQSRQKLCLYFPNGLEWNSTMPVSKIVPWVAKWFYFYESWVVTGIWNGGGIHISDEAYSDMSTSRLERRLKERLKSKS